MNREQVLSDIKEKFKNDITEVFDKSPKRVYVSIKPEALISVASYMFRDIGARFNIASGTDMRDRIEILYHFFIEDINLIVSYRVHLPKDKLEIDSLISVFKASDWIERELHEILGVTFKGHPNLKRLLLPDEWPEGVYPLRCDYKEWDPNAIRDRGI